MVQMSCLLIALSSTIPDVARGDVASSCQLWGVTMGYGVTCTEAGSEYQPN